MCGITGYWNKHSRMGQQAFDAFTDSLRHRGPDGRGTFFDPASSLFLGHRRLSILDLSQAASQPISDTSNRYTLTFNGELYNYIELKQELVAKGYVFKTTSDTEVLLYSYVEWGRDCLYKFNGMWAFAIYDKKDQSLFISRDRFGVKPLYYYETTEIFAFASELKSFMSLEGTVIDFNAKYIENQLHGVFSTSSPETFLKNVFELPPGNAAFFRLGQPIKTYVWWQSEYHLPIIPSTKKRQIEHFQSLFFDACRIRLRSDAKLGFSVSGGLDSSSVLSSAFFCAKQSKKFQLTSDSWNNAFTVLYPNTPQDEHAHFRLVTKKTKSTCYESIIKPQNFDPCLLKKMAYSFESLIDLPLGPWKMYENYRTQGIYVSLEGHGPDELMGGYHHQIYDLLTQTKNLSFYQYANLKKTYLNFFSQEKTNHLKLKIPKQEKTLKSFLNFNRSSPDKMNARFFQDFHLGSLPYILRNFDRVSMAHGIEVRSPFLDWRLVCYILALPSSMKLAHGSTKFILREAMKGILPEPIRNRRSKMGFADPLQQWIEPYFKDFLLDHVCSSFFLEAPYWDGPSLAKQVKSHTNTDNLLYLWKYFVCSLLLESFKEQQIKTESSLS